MTHIIIESYRVDFAPAGVVRAAGGRDRD